MKRAKPYRVCVSHFLLDLTEKFCLYIMPDRLSLSTTFCFLAMSLVKSRGFGAIAARCHAAPTAAMILGCIIKIQHTVGTFTLPEISGIAIAEQIGCRFGNRRKQLPGSGEVGVEAFFKTIFTAHNF